MKSMAELQSCMAQNIKAAKEAAEVLHGAGEGGADGQQGSRLMKHGEADHLQFLKKMKGNLHVATCVAMSRFNKALAKIILAVVTLCEYPMAGHRKCSLRGGVVHRGRSQWPVGLGWTRSWSSQP